LSFAVSYPFPQKDAEKDGAPRQCLVAGAIGWDTPLTGKGGLMNGKQQHVSTSEPATSVKPTRFAKGGRGEQIAFTTEKTPFGWMVVGAAGRGLCWLALAGTKTKAEATLREEFPLAALKRDSSLAGWIAVALAVVSHPSRKNKDAARVEHPSMLSGSTSPSKKLAAPLVLDLRGTAFQLRVWQALRQIPRGETRSYSQLAKELCSPNATRAVARACAMNRVALVVPCHRVVGASGALTGYRWGLERKRKLLEAEGRKML
jgi:AraC family transcriptional regulator, regulatory protein of adaptative response / methylated-DNA-[protein]-cysteine methyltransferase